MIVQVACNEREGHFRRKTNKLDNKVNFCLNLGTIFLLGFRIFQVRVRNLKSDAETFVYHHLFPVQKIIHVTIQILCVNYHVNAFRKRRYVMAKKTARTVRTNLPAVCYHSGLLSHLKIKIVNSNLLQLTIASRNFEF